MIAHDRRIAENAASDYMETLFSDRAIVSDHMETRLNAHCSKVFIVTCRILTEARTCELLVKGVYKKR